MRDFVAELSSLVQEAQRGVEDEEFEAWAQRTGRDLPEELKRLYRAFNGGRFPGDVVVARFAQVLTAPESGPTVLGHRGGSTQLLMLTRDELAAQLEGELPGWLVDLPGDAFVYAVQEPQSALKPVRTFEGVLDRVLAPRETETFGETTFARGMSAVQEVLETLPELVAEAAEPAVKAVARAVKPLKKAVRRAVKSVAKGAKKKLSTAAQARPAKSKSGAKKKSPAKKAVAAKGARKPSARRKKAAPKKKRR